MKKPRRLWQSDPYPPPVTKVPDQSHLWTEAEIKAKTVGNPRLRAKLLAWLRGRS